MATTRIVNALDRIRSDFGSGAARRKLELLRTLAKDQVLGRAGDVLRLHEALCFLRAYPDDPEILAEAEGMLSRFSSRRDLRRHRDALEDSGIAGTTISFAFYPVTAIWLARRFGDHLTIDWEAFERKGRLEPLLPLLALYCETLGLDDFALGMREWIQRLKRPGETDAAFLMLRFEQLAMSPFAREAFLDDLDVPFRLAPGPDTPARTRERYSRAPSAYQTTPLRRGRPSLAEEAAQPPRAIRMLARRDGRVLVDLARSTMVARDRDLDAFAYADSNDVRLVDCGGGLSIACIGVIPERRFLLETLYGFLALKNGVPIGYGTYTCLFNSTEIAYTIFDAFRGAEAAFVYGKAISVAKHVLGCDTFMIDPYQLGEDNEDAIRSGAWWFYQKLGFRPRETALLRLMREEQRRMRKKPAHRSSARTLRTLCAANVYLHLGAPRDDVIGVLPFGNVGLHITARLARRFGHDRERAERECAAEAAGILGLKTLQGFSAGERLAWKRWSPLVTCLLGIKRWPSAEKRHLVALVRAKGGRRESDYLLRFDGHARLRSAVRRLAESEPDSPIG